MCTWPWTVVSGECNPHKFCVNGVVTNTFAPGPQPILGRVTCVSHDYIIRLIQASNSVTEKYATSGLGQLGIKWQSEPLGGVLYIKGVHTEM